MITPYSKLTSDGYVLCLPGQVKLDAGKLGSYLSALKVTTDERGYTAVDDNGTSLTLLDPDLDRKLVIIGDLNLYFALQQDPSCFEDVWVEVVSELPKGRKWYY